MMKKTLLLICSFTLAIFAVANDAELIVQKINNNGIASGTTYRVYARLLHPNQTLHAIWGNALHPLYIHTTTSFYQDTNGGYSSASLSMPLIEIYPALAFDSFITLGYENMENNDLWDTGIDFSTFENGGDITADNGAWYLIPTHEKCTPDENGLLLIGQFTSTGVVSGQMNLQGWSAPQVTWQALGLSFTSDDAKIFGCMDGLAQNYSSEADFDDGSCLYGELPTEVVSIHSPTPDRDWEIFPNPLRNALLHIQIYPQHSFTKEPAMIRIYSIHGKLVANYALNSGELLPGNKLTFIQELAGGAYKVELSQGKYKNSKTLIVE